MSDNIVERAALEDAHRAVDNEWRDEVLPHRDDLAEVVLHATLPFRGVGGQTIPYVMPVHYAIADAVLARLAAQGAAAPTVTAEQAARAETAIYEWLNRRAADDGTSETTTVQALMREVRAAFGIGVTR